MADEQTPPTGQAPASGQEPQGPGQQPPAGQAPAEQFDPERAKSLIEKLRGEDRATRAELAAARDALKKYEDQQLSESERAAKRTADLERQLSEKDRAHQERILRYETQLAASKLNIVDPDAAVKLMDWSKIDYDKDGQPTNIDTVLKELVRSKPYLVTASQPGPTPSPTNPARQSQVSAHRYTTSQLKSHDFYLANKADIQLAMREGRIDNE